MISRWRNKDKKGASNSSATILPSTFSMDRPNSPSSQSNLSNPPSYRSTSSSSSSRAYSRNHNVPGHIRPVTCTNFLMGGQYYPGKDKKRNMLRRKTLWYRIFCSSKTRVVASCAVLAYVLIMFLLVPAVDIIYDYGDMLARSKKASIPLPASLKDKVMSKMNNARKNKARRVMNGDDHSDIGKVGSKPSPVEDGKEEEEVTDDHDFEKEENDVEEGKGEGGGLAHERKKAEEEKHKTQEKIKQMLDAKKHEILAETVVGEGEKKQTVEGEQVPKMEIKPLDISKEDVKRMNDKLNQINKDPQVKKEKDDILKKIAPEFHDAAAKGRNYNEDNEKIKEKEKSATEVEEKTSIVAEKRTILNREDHHKFSSCPKRGVEKVSVTLVTQTTFDRLNVLQLTCQRWKLSPLIVAVYLTQDEYDTMWNSSQSELKKVCNNDTVLIPYVSKSDEERTLKYPINTLRNQALDHVTSSHVFITDIDMIPSDGLDSTILDSIDLAIERRYDDDGDSALDPWDAIIVPAFEKKLKEKCKTLEECQDFMKKDEKFIPKDMQELKEQIMVDQCIVFQSDVNKDGHHTTNTKEWIESSYDLLSSKRGLKVIECFESFRYEPFVVIPWCALKSNAEQLLIREPGPRSPYFDERFYGYGKNKIQHIAHMRRIGFQFLVMPPTGFITHFPHPVSSTKETWNDTHNFELHSKMDLLYSKFLKELEKVYKFTYNQTPICRK